jgi:hypothetical protein
MKKILSTIVLLIVNNLLYSQTPSNNKIISQISTKCISEYQTLIKNLKNKEGQYNWDIAKYYNLFYYGIDVENKSPNNIRDFFSKGSSYQVDENSGLVFLIHEVNFDESWSKKQYYYLKIFHPIAGPLQFYFDPEDGFLLLPNQNKKVSITSRKYSQDFGFTLEVVINKLTNEITTKIEDKYNRCCNEPSLDFLFDNENKFKEIIDYPLKSNLNTFFATKRVVDKVKVINYKYTPSREEKLALWKIGALSDSDFTNPNYFIMKQDEEKTYKNEVFGRKGIRHYLNDCFDELESSFSNYFIFKKDNKFGILDATWGSLKNGDFVLTENLFDKISYNKGTETFTASKNNATFIIDIKGNIIK